MRGEAESALHTRILTYSHLWVNMGTFQGEEDAMAKTNESAKTNRTDAATKSTKPLVIPRYCCQPAQPFMALATSVTGDRLRAIIANHKTWANGTVLSYYLFADPQKYGVQAGNEADCNAVRAAFDTWASIGIGISFKEVDQPNKAILRVGFDQSDGSWSFVGRDNLSHASPKERTMNFGWALTDAYGRDTAKHEIGHALGLNHEHQNPNAGIIWNTSEVIDYFSGPPNNWSVSEIQSNILDKLPGSSVTGSNWDPDSIMHYQFKAGLIEHPPKYQSTPLIPHGGFSSADKAWSLTFYPPQDKTRFPTLVPHQSQIVAVAHPGQADYLIEPDESRKYDLRLFGNADAILLVYQVDGDTEHYISGDDDTGKDSNAALNVRLDAGKHYLLRVKIHYSPESEPLSLMMW